MISEAADSSRHPVEAAVEEVETSPAAFEAPVEAVNRYEVTAVVLPSMLHFAVLSAPAAIKDYFERATGARVMVANSPP